MGLCFSLAINSDLEVGAHLEVLDLGVLVAPSDIAYILCPISFGVIYRGKFKYCPMWPKSCQLAAAMP